MQEIFILVTYMEKNALNMNKKGALIGFKFSLSCVFILIKFVRRDVAQNINK